MSIAHQRPLMRKKPTAGQDVTKLKPKQYNPAAHILTIQAQTILEMSVSARRVSYKTFLNNFSNYTKKDFEVKLREIQESSPDFSLENIVDDLHFYGHLCTLQKGIREDMFVFTPFEPRTPHPQPVQKAVPPINSVSQKKVSVSIDSATETNSESIQVSQNGISHHTHRKQAEIDELLKEYSQKLFSQPSWPWLNDMHREKYRKMFLKFLQSVDGGLADYQQVFLEAKKLASELWETIPNFPHALYLLHLLSKQHPNGFEFFDLHSELDKVIPLSWRERNVYSEDIIPEPSILILKNLIIPTGPDESGLVKVNQLIDYVGFHEIWDREISMVYFFVGSTPDSKSSECVHEFMSKHCPEWSDNYDKTTGAARVNSVCLEKKKMFRTEDNHHKTKKHLYRIGVPMFFPTSPVISPYNS